MRKFYLLCTLVLAMLLGGTSYAQDFSNKGKDFWVGYGYHQVMGAGNQQQMVLYFATDQVTNITITIPALGYSQLLTSPPGNNVLTSAVIPKAGAQDARLLTEGLSDKGIHITSDKAMVAYAHIYNSSVSGATILFPTNTLGKEYYSVNYKNWSNSPNANCWFYVVATDTGTTKIEITPTGNTTGGWIAGTTYAVNLTQGQIYNVMGALINSPANCNPVCTGYDLTGSKIQSIASASGGCKKIAVFSGSGRISITCTANNSSSDNYMVQAFPKTAWGKKYLTVPAAGNQAFNFYRICVTDPTTIVKVNGVVTFLPLQAGFYYELAATNQPQLIEADKPVMVAQYFTSQGACGNGAQPGDPEVIYLSPVEQNINKVLWNATPNFAITSHFFNVVIPNTGTAVSSFRLDGAVPVGAFVAHPQDPGYVYLQQSVSPGFHYIQSDSGFNSMAYGFGNAESYGYNGGTNIRDLFQFIQLINPYGTVPFPATCRGTPFNFAMVFPYRPTQIQWIFGAALNAMGINDTTIYNGGLPLVEDSSWVVAGRTIYRYKLPSTYFITTVGIYPIKVIATNPTPDGCGNEQVIDFDVQVFEQPIADFTFISDGCVTNPVNFFDNSNTWGRPISRRYWDFGDATNSFLAAPSHLYPAAGTYNVKYSLITDVGCLADTVMHPVTLTDPPVANFSVSGPPYCPGVPVAFTDMSTASGGAIINQWTWNFGDPPSGPNNISNLQNPTHIFSGPGTYTVTLVVTTTTGCSSFSFPMQVTIVPDGTVTLTSVPGTNNQTVCINMPITNITYAVGGSGTGGSVSGLPAGVTGSFAGGVITITGTPTVSGVFNYTVTTTGPCVTPTANGTITVTADGTITLSSATGTDNQTVCINTPIVAITYAVGGSGTGGSVTGLPAGVTGSFAGGVITISGTPSVSGTFNYTVNTTGPCVVPTASGRITVTADGTLTLTSAPGTNNQTVCINIPIINITYAVGGTGTGGSVSGLPAGVTGTFAGGVITITGTPTVAGVYNYTVNTTGPCVTPSANGTITVTADGTLTLTSASGTDNQTVCINTPIVAITYAVGGSGTGGSVTGLPAGVTGSFAFGVITISGTPSVSGTFNYTVNSTGPCVVPTASGRITVTANGTLTLSSAPGTNNQTVCINTPIINITYTVGGTGTGGSVSGLPAGVTGTFAGGVITITGTPTVAGVYNYTVNTTGPCVTPSANGTITVTADGTVTLTSASGTDNQTVCINTPIVAITYAVGGSGTGGSVTGLPAGVTGSFAGGVITISGTPSVSGTFNYTVNSTGPCVIPTASGRITVTANGTLTLSSAPGTNTQTVCINTPIINITYTVGGTGTGGSVSGLPAGVTGTFAGGVITITGTPTVSGTFNYTVTTTGPCGTPSANGTITVTPDGTLTLTSGAGTDNQNACINNPIIPITYAVGGSGTGGSVSGLPAGVTGTFAFGVITISGSPTVSGLFTYTVTTTGPCVKPTATGTINVTSVATITLTSAPGTNNQTVCINTAITNITYLVGGSGTGGSVIGLPAGVTGNFAGGVITISGTPTVVGTFNYTVNTTGPCGTPSANGTITVNDNSTLNLTSAPGSNVQTVCINTPITNISYAVGGGGTGASITAGSLPAGVSGVYSGGVFTISGTPTVSGVFNFTVGTSGPCTNPTATGTITVTADATLTLTSAPATTNQTVCINTAITNITYAVGGSGTGGSVSGLPTGVTGTYAGGVITITGTPSVAGTFNYTVTTTGPCVKPTATGTIIVNDNSTLTLSSGPGSNVQTVCINTPINNIIYTVSGGGTGASITAGSLPAGVSGVYSGGIFTISGTPTVSGTFNFTIGTTGPCINASQSGTLTVTADAALTLTSAPATTNQTVCINTAITNITYAVGGSGTGGSVSGLPTGVTGTYAGGVITITGTPSVAGTFNYTVTTTGPCVKPTATGTIIVNDNSTLNLSSAPGSNIQTVCVNNAITDIRYTVGGGGTGASITAGSLPAGVSGVYSGGVFTISGTPTVNGTFNFTVGTTGPCINTSQSGTITVTATSTLNLSSAPGTDVQTICVNNAIGNIRYTIGGSGTGASITAGSLPPGVNGVYSGGVFTISGTATASGVFNFTVGSSGPCLNPTMVGTITVNPDHTISLSSAASTTSQTVCSDKLITPIAYTLGGGASGATVTGLPPGVTSSISGSTLTITGAPTIAGSFNYSIITTGNSCITASKNGSISVLQTPAVVFDPVPGVCADVPSFQVTASPASGVFSGPGINATGLFNPAAAGAGNHIIRYTFTAANGCANFQEQTLAVFPMPIANAGPDKFMLEGGQVTLTPGVVNAQLVVTYTWAPNFHLSDPNIAYTIASPPFDFTYTLTVTTDNGCALSDDVFVKVLKAPAIPNIFSPNGDGIHDTWVIQYLDTYPGSTVDIYNRYGQRIYHSEGYTTAWDGTVNGKPVPIGTYYYIVDPKNGRKIMSGYVDVIR